MDEETQLYYLAFSHFYGIGPIKFNALMKHFKSAKKAYQAEPKDLILLLGNILGTKFIEFRQKFEPKKKFKELTQKKISILTSEDKNYPNSLRNITDPPICLYVKGNLKQLSFNNEDNYFFAVVGTRKPTAYGQQITKKLTFELSTAGLIIVSGMALGIDTLAHQAALEAEGKTIAVLGCGVDVIYPPTNTKLYQQIINQGGLIISEFPPGQFVLPGLFVARNRIISGLSMGILVVEGAKDSGALITARYAANQGKDVFAPPSPLTSPMGAAPNLLLKQGAKLVTDANDILEEFNLKVVSQQTAKIVNGLDKDEKIFFDLLLAEPRLVDELKEKTKQPINNILKILSLLEIKSLIEKNSEGKYQAKIN
jgi:DNA processing protein